jgi:tetratricopeptide (TPR) repeat protein
MNELETQIVDEFYSGDLDFVKGVLVASGLQSKIEVQSVLTEIADAIEDSKTKINISDPLVVTHYLSIAKSNLEHLFHLVDRPKGGDCLLRTILVNTWLTRLGFETKVARLVTQNKGPLNDYEISCHVSSVVDDIRLPDIGFTDENLMYICVEEHFDNFALVSYTYYQRGNIAKRAKSYSLALMHYHKAIVFNPSDFLIWEQIADTLIDAGKPELAKTYELIENQLRPQMTLMSSSDKVAFKHLY